MDFYVNGHLLDQARFAKDGEVLYQHDVPEEWLKNEVTTVRMRSTIRTSRRAMSATRGGAAVGGLQPGRDQPSSPRARSKTARNIASVSLPVEVFCWLG